MIVINEYVAKKEYKGKTIVVNVFDGFCDDQRVTKLYCPKYDSTIITLNNPSDEQIKNEVRNIIRSAEEIIDEKSIVNKIKRLFR